MAAISIAINRGVSGLKISDFTIGTSAPTASTDFEFRYNTTDQLTHTVTKMDLDLALEAIRRLINDQLQSPAGTWVITAPPL